MTCQYGHYITRDEAQRGTLEVGKYADAEVLAGDPLTCSLDELKSIKVDMTIVNGRVVHAEHS